MSNLNYTVNNYIKLIVSYISYEKISDLTKSKATNDKLILFKMINI